MKPPLHAPKRRGEWVELQFMARAHAHGLIVSKPWGDSARYDFIVECPTTHCHPEQAQPLSAGKRSRASKDPGNANRSHAASRHSSQTRETRNEKRETRFSRVQVKSTFQRLWYGRNRGAYMCNTVSRAPYAKERSYSAKEIDFFAFFLIPEDLWYIVPIADIADVRFAVQLNPYQPKNKYFRYLEAWHLLQK